MINHDPHRELLENCAASPLGGPARKWEDLYQILVLPPSYLEFVLLVCTEEARSRSGPLCPEGGVHGAAQNRSSSDDGIFLCRSPN
jgi:hypothetical protein